ncbi:uncharacterized protein [Malus domestica]|uniref:uncharacterized protein n=1 Tax=Malus domestica TaxID=3750 RepID=UPI003976CB3B
MPSRVVELCTPLQVLTEHVPVVSTNTLTPQVFGCVAYVHIHKIQRSKLHPYALRCVFLGFASQQKSYKCYHPETYHMYVTMDVTFSESEYFYTPIFPPSDPKGESVICDLDGVFGWLDVQDVCPSGEDDNTVLKEEARDDNTIPREEVGSRLLPTKDDIDGQPLIAAEETCTKNPCVVSGVQPPTTEAEPASPQAFAKATSHEICIEACHHPIRVL